jgi:hypothetical protein
MVKLRLRTLLAVASLTFLCGTSVHAQALYGGVVPDAGATTRLDFTASLVQGYDSDVPTFFLQTIDPQSAESEGMSTILNTSAEYAWKKSRAQIGINASSALRHYADLGVTRGVGSSFGVGASIRLPGRTTLMMNQGGAYSPAFLSDLFPTGATIEPGTPVDTAPDYTVSNFKSYNYSSIASLRHDFSPRSNFVVSGEFQFTDRSESPLWQDVSSHVFTGQYSRNLTRNTAISAQYLYRSGAFGYTNDLRTTEQTVQLGVSYTKPLSATRRATIRFAAGASAPDVPESVRSSDTVFRQNVGNVSADFEYQFQRTWQARVNFRRGIEYVVDIPEPVYADSLGIGVEGLLSRRVDLAIGGGYSTGDSIFNGSPLAYDTYTGSIRARYALSRLSAIYTEYLYYLYDFSDGTRFIVGVPPGLKRHAIRVGLSLWMPAMRK